MNSDRSKQLDAFGGGGGQQIPAAATVRNYLDQLAGVLDGQGRFTAPISLTRVQLAEVRKLMNACGVGGKLRWGKHPLREWKEF